MVACSSTIVLLLIRRQRSELTTIRSKELLTSMLAHFARARRQGFRSGHTILQEHVFGSDLTRFLGPKGFQLRLQSNALFLILRNRKKRPQTVNHTPLHQHVSPQVAMLFFDSAGRTMALLSGRGAPARVAKFRNTFDQSGPVETSLRQSPDFPRSDVRRLRPPRQVVDIRIYVSDCKAPW